MLVQAFISYRLDYCNSLFYGITEDLMSRLQSVQNAAARLVSGARRYDHITPVQQPTGAALASNLTSGGFQNRHPGLSTRH